jgi:hypothetical protein
MDSYLKASVSADEYSTILTGIMKAKRRKQFQGKVHKNISSSFRTPMSGGLQTPNKFGSNLSSSGNRLSTAEKLQEYKNRLNNKQNIPQNEEKPKEPGSKPEVENKLSGSIAAMNSSITEKWRKINSQGLKNHSGMNNTVGGGFKRQALQDKSTFDKDSNENEAEPENATNSKMALQLRLNEVKARLGQIKKTVKK